MQVSGKMGPVESLSSDGAWTPTGLECQQKKMLSLTKKTAWKWKLSSSLTQTSHTETTQSLSKERNISPEVRMQARLKCTRLAMWMWSATEPSLFFFFFSAYPGNMQKMPEVPQCQWGRDPTLLWPVLVSDDSAAGSSQQVMRERESENLAPVWLCDRLTTRHWKSNFLFRFPLILCLPGLFKAVCSLEYCPLLTLYSGKPTCFFNAVIISNNHELLRGRKKRLLIYLIN